MNSKNILSSFALFLFASWCLADWEVASINHDGIELKNISTNTLYTYISPVDGILYGGGTFYIKNPHNNLWESQISVIPVDSCRTKPLEIMSVNCGLSIMAHHDLTPFAGREIIIMLSYSKERDIIHHRKNYLIGPITIPKQLKKDKDPNQQVDPIVKTPVDEVEAQGTQGHP